MTWAAWSHPGDHHPPKTDGWTPDFPEVGVVSGCRRFDRLRHPGTLLRGFISELGVQPGWSVQNARDPPQVGETESESDVTPESGGTEGSQPVRSAESRMCRGAGIAPT